MSEVEQRQQRERLCCLAGTAAGSGSGGYVFFFFLVLVLSRAKQQNYQQVVVATAGSRTRAFTSATESLGPVAKEGRPAAPRLLRRLFLLFFLPPSFPIAFFLNLLPSFNLRVFLLFLLSFLPSLLLHLPVPSYRPSQFPLTGSFRPFAFHVAFIPTEGAP